MPEKQFRRRPSGLDRLAFLAIYGPVYEHSPWIAETVFDAGLEAVHDGPDGLHAAMRAVVEAASHEHQLALLRAHPDLAGRLAVRGELTARSASEQAGVGLDKCEPEELVKFTRLNEAYKAKFGIPFVMAIKGRERGEILAAFERRLGNDMTAEFRTALDEVHKIARFRLADLQA
jgi:2-oxo-4-hydroxy-4-carboxy-5-ureidoimidazoline decarboxylase